MSGKVEGSRAEALGSLSKCLVEGNVEQLARAKRARIWGGGGHAQAAGATLMMSLAQAENEVLPRLRALVNETA